MQALKSDVHKVTLPEYLTACELGLFENTELVDGTIYNMAPLSVLHSDVQDILRDWLKSLNLNAKTNGTVSDEIMAGREPDVFVVERKFTQKPYFHPEEVPLAIEVALSTLDRDLQKINDYALLHIPTVWIVDLQSPRPGIIEYTDLDRGAYKSIRHYFDGDSICFRSHPFDVSIITKQLKVH